MKFQRTLLNYRTTVAVMGGQFMVGVAAEHREQAKMKGGDTIEVTIELDDAPRTVDGPDDFAASSRKAKAPETRLRRIAKSVDKILKP